MWLSPFLFIPFPELPCNSPFPLKPGLLSDRSSFPLVLGGSSCVSAPQPESSLSGKSGTQVTLTLGFCALAWPGTGGAGAACWWQ